MARFFIPEEDIQGDLLRVREDAHHILHVLRMGIGDTITLCDGEGTDYICQIEEIEGDTLLCRANARRTAETEPEMEITLFQGIPKGDKMEWIIEKGVETGLSRIVPVQMARSVSHIEGKKAGNKVQRWNKISRSAAKQSQRGRIPQVEAPIRLTQCLERLKEYDMVLVFYEEERRNSLRRILQTASRPRKAAILIGPEGGLEPDEVRAFVGAGAKVAGLGPRILRTETAGPIATALLLYEWGQM